jgi:Ring finger domain
VDSERSPYSSQPSRPPRAPLPDERDVCPICNRILPPRGADGDESARETHVRDCIERHGPRGRSPPLRAAGGPGAPRAVSTMRMVAFAATEKDCVGEDGGAQECTICMEEYEVGAMLVRLECLCKFHQTCIVEWFERKRECPVHKRT